MKKQIGLLALTLLLPTLPSFAFNGLQDIGFGAPSKGVGGCAAAFPQDTLTAITNPANLVPVGTRADIYAEYIRGTRTGQIYGSTYQYTDANQKIDLSRNRNIIAGEAGGSIAFLNDRFAMGLLIAPQAGGVLTWNKPDVYDPTPIQDTHLNVMYVSFTPTFAGQILNNEYIGKHFIGAGVDLTGAMIKVAGLELLETLGGILGATVYPKNVTDNGYDWAFGWAVRVGWLGEFFDWLSLGISYKTRTYMGDFDKYKGLLSPHGRCDLPAQLIGGIAIKPFQQTNIVFDMGELYYDDVEALSNPVYSETLNNPHGAKNGAGFGWKSITVYKVGICQRVSDSIKVRVGYNYGQLPWRENMPNAVAGALYLPTTIRHHLTMGGSYSGAAGAIISASFVYGFKHRIKGPNQQGLIGGGRTHVTTDLYQLEIGISKVW